MRRLLLLLLLCALPASAQWTHVSATFAGVSTGGSIGTLTIPANAELVVTLNVNGAPNGTTTSVVPSGTTCHTAFAKFASVSFSTSLMSEIWVASGCTATSTGSVTVNFTGGGAWVMGIHIMTGLGDPVVADGSPATNSAGSSSNPQSGPTCTAAVNGDFIIGLYDPQHSVTTGSGFGAGWSVNGAGSNNMGDGWVTSNSVAASTPETPSFTLNSSGAFTAVTMGFKPGAPANGRGPKGKIL